jgi:biopolymer transport protein ExbD
MGGAAGGGGKGRLRKLPKKPKIDAVRNEINVTPLVDVCLVLLIIFMVITPLMARGKEVPLPQTSFHSNEKDRQQPVVSIDKTETVHLSGLTATNRQYNEVMGKLGEQGLIPKLKEKIEWLWEQAKNPEAKGRMFIKVDNSLTYGRIYPLIEGLNDPVAGLGQTQFDLGTAEKRGGE